MESVQRDRSRLQEECIVLSTELEQARAEIADLQQQVRDREAESRAQATLSAAMHDKETQEVSLEEKEEDLTEGSGRKSSGRLGELSSGYMSGASPPVSPSIDSAKYNAFTPKAMAKQLKMELMRTHSQVRLSPVTSKCLYLRASLCIILQFYNS